MCLTVHKNKKHKIKFGKTGYRIFWKKIEIWQDVRGVVLRGWYFTEYCYNRGWNYPTTLLRCLVERRNLCWSTSNYNSDSRYFYLI
jgi:hypothetical protein